MRRWKFCSILTLVLGYGALGCGGGGNKASTISLSIAPPTASVITNTTQPFSAFVSGSTDQTATWAVTCPTGVTAPACGTIDTNGLYTAPKTVPTVTTNGTTTAAPTATITATAHADSTKTATATITIISGVSILISPTTSTVGTLETFQFSATVNNPGCVNSPGTMDCLSVTWSVPTTTCAASAPNCEGKIDASGNYTAPQTAPNPSTVTITATSVKDTTVTATAQVMIVTAADPTLTSVSPKTAAVGSLFQDIYITGTNFISTNKVFVNNTEITGVGVDSLPNVSVISSSVIRVRVPDSALAAAGTLQVTVRRQTQMGTPPTCTPDPTQCQVMVSGVRPAVVGPSPDNIQQGTSGAISFDVNGGFFGTSGSPAVSATFAGQLRTAQVTNARQMSVIIGGNGSNASDFSTPGLYPVAIYSAADATKFAVTNVAVQPNYSISSITSKATLTAGLPNSPVAASPSDVAINPATGTAVVANAGTNDVTLINLTTLAVDTPSICTAAVGAGAATLITPCPASGPKSVAIDYVQNIALVLNTTSQTVAVVDLNAKAVKSVIPLFQTPPSDAAQHPPVSVGINPVTGRALVTIQNRAYGLLLDVTQTPPVVVGPVTISTGANSRIAVDPHLNWAIATPGGVGSIGIVDLNRQNLNNIASLSRTLNVVTVTVQPSTTAVPQSPLAVRLGDTVLIQGVSDTTFNGFYTVTGLGPGGGQFSYTQTGASLKDVPSAVATGTVNYAAPVATLALTTTIQGIGINTETQQAVLVDPSPNGFSKGVVSFFSLLDQSVSSTILRVGDVATGAAEFGSVAAAFNPLTNVAVTVNPITNTLSVIDPSTPKRLTSTTSFPSVVLDGPVAVAVDPGTNLAVVANQTNNSVSIISLGPIQPLSITETSPKEFVVNSTLQSVAPPSALNPLTVIGKGFSNSSVVRLDGNPLIPTSASDRQITVVVPPSLLTSARRFALDVLNPDGTVSNASDFTVKQSVDVSSTACSTPLPAGVAVDSTLGTAGTAVVSLSGCNSAALIDLATGTGQTVAVGANPIGVAVLPRLHKAIVADNLSNSASVVDEVSQSVTNINTGAGPIGVAADQDTGEAAVANSVANTVTVLTVASGGARSITSGQHPIAVAFDYPTHQIAVAADASNAVGVGSASATSLTTSFPVSIPTALAYDAASNTFLAASSANNSITIYDPTIQAQTAFLRVGINPTAIAYNYLTGTLISTNTGSHTITVADIQSSRIRAVLTLPPPPVNSAFGLFGAFQFAVDIHPLMNLAVITDTANGRVLLVPVPR